MPSKEPLRARINDVPVKLTGKNSILHPPQHGDRPLEHSFPALYLIADPSFYNTAKGHAAFFHAMTEAIAGGIRWIQYRDKARSRAEMYRIARNLRVLTREQGVTLIINDEIDLAMAVQADGVHLGQEDFPVAMARRLLGEDCLIGLSTHTLQQAIGAEREALDYIGFGPILKTQTKLSENTPLGLEALAALKSRTSLPVYAIGGIQHVHLAKIRETGVSGAAVSSALAGAGQETIRSWMARLNP